jgi:hypothetical protein
MLFLTALYQTVNSSGWLLNNVTEALPSFEITSKPSLNKKEHYIAICSTQVIAVKTLPQSVLPCLVL